MRQQNPQCRLVQLGIRAVFIFALGCALAPNAALADIRYTTSMQIGMPSGQPMPTGMPQMRKTTMVKDMRQREEQTMDMGNVHQDTITLTECDKRQIVEMDPDLKIYSIRSMDAVPGMTSAPSMGPQPNQPHPGDSSGTGKLVSTYTIQDLGTEKILDLDTHHYMMNMNVSMSGCAGNGDYNSKMEIWVAPVKGTLDCPEMYAPSRDVTTDSGCKMTVEQKGDLAKFSDIYHGMTVREKIYNGDQVVMTMDTREYSTAALDQALFEVPADYKQVTHAQFTKAQGDHMSDQMKHYKPSDNPNGDTTPTPDTNSTDQGSQNNGQGNNQNNNQNNGTKKKHGFHIPLPF